MLRSSRIRNTVSLSLKVFCGVLALSGVSIASPTVSGMTISWPAGDWYQVQRADNYESICNGGSSCDVPTGEYIVINHTNGERFDIVVGSATAPTTSIAVSGQLISWPDDGWYQVQRTDTYASVCNGGRQCSVEPGQYVVINHSTGNREEVIVRASDDPIAPGPSPSGPSDSAIEVSADNIISWPDDGWYEVQSASTYESVCTGGRNCVVPQGSYTVINHSTGQRFEGIEVGSVAPSPAPTPTLNSTPITVQLPKSNSIPTDGRWSEGRSSPWQFNTQWSDTNGDSLQIDSQVQGPPGVPNSRREATTTSGGARWAANYSDTHLQILILGPEGLAYPTASIFLDTDNSKGSQYDGVNDYHLIIPVNSRDGQSWENNFSSDDGGNLLYGEQSAYLDPSAIQFGTCSCAGHETLWEINIDLAAANIPVNKAFGFDVRLSWGIRNAGEERVDYSFGWADGLNPNRATPANMGTMILLSE